MNAVPTGPAAIDAPSLAYAEGFVPERDALRTARDSARTLGVSPVSPGVTALLTVLTRAIEARAVVEIGTGTGVSGLALLAGMGPEGILTSIDAEPEHQASARQALTAAGIATRRARLIAGGALQVLPKLSDGAYDLVFVDGDPLEYVEYVEQALRLLRPGGLLVLHHALAGGGVADQANEADETVIVREALEAVSASDELTATLLPVGDGVLVATRG